MEAVRLDAIEMTRNRFAEDAFPQYLGISLLELAPGYAKVSLRLQPHMLNFHGIAHGGAIFTLSDTAFGLASNSHGDPAVALSMTINFLAPAHPGTTLVATAREEHRTKRTGVYNIKVEDDQGRMIALVQGTVYRKPKPSHLQP